MKLNKINWKILLKNPDDAEPNEYFTEFSSWIENSPEVFVDASDYEHVANGPITVLIGYACDYWLDNTNNKKGLIYNQRQKIDLDNVALLKKTLFELIQKTKIIESSKTFKKKQSFKADYLELLVNDRLLAPNNDETFNTVKTDLEKIFDTNKFNLIQSKNEKQRFSIVIESKDALTMSDLEALVK